MYTKSYQSTVEFLSEQAPNIEHSPGKFIQWAEALAELLSFIYCKEYEDVTTDITDAAKEQQGYEDSSN